MKDQSKASSTGNSNHVVPRKALRLQNSTRARRACVAVVFVTLYVLLDRSTVFFQMWSGVSAWYPPSGLSLAMLIGFGGSYMPLVMLGGAIAGVVNYHQSVFSFNTIGANLAVSACSLRATEWRCFASWSNVKSISLPWTCRCPSRMA